jgi:hypothetical protein
VLAYQGHPMQRHLTCHHEMPENDFSWASVVLNVSSCRVLLTAEALSISAVTCPPRCQIILKVPQNVESDTMVGELACRFNGRILLANLLQRSRSTFAWRSFLSFFAFKESMLGTPISVLWGWPTVSGR